MQTTMNKIAPGGPPAYEPRTGGVPDGQWIINLFFTPIIAPMLHSRWLARILVAVGVSQILLVASGWGGWQCPIRSTVGIACPGCGMTTALALLYQGNWRAAMHVHAFAPLVLIVLVLITLAAILPARHQGQLSQAVASIERHTGISALALFGMLVYWLLRL